MSTVSKKEVFLVTMEEKQKDQEQSHEIVLGCFLDEAVAISIAEELYQEKRNRFLERVRSYSDYMPTGLSDGKNCRYISYCPVGPWKAKEFMSIHVTNNYLLTDM